MFPCSCSQSVNLYGHSFGFAALTRYHGIKAYFGGPGVSRRPPFQQLQMNEPTEKCARETQGCCDASWREPRPWHHILQVQKIEHVQGQVL